MIELKNVCKSFGEKSVIEKFSAKFAGKVCVTGESGAGKTTLLRLILGLETPDNGEITPKGLRYGVCFQEDRLFDSLNAQENIRLTTGIKNPEAELSELLPADSLNKPVKKLSGGQRRRVCIVRAMCAEADAFVLDEPFAGLDAENKAIAWSYICKKAGDKPVILALHEGDIPENILVIRIN